MPPFVAARITDLSIKPTHGRASFQRGLATNITNIMIKWGPLEERINSLTQLLKGLDIYAVDIVFVCNNIASSIDSRYIEIHGYMIDILSNAVPRGKLREAKVLAEKSDTPLRPYTLFWLRCASYQKRAPITIKIPPPIASYVLSQQLDPVILNFLIEKGYSAFGGTLPKKVRTLYHIIQCVGIENIRSRERLETLYKWRIAMRKAAQKALENDVGRPLVLEDIRTEVIVNAKKGLNRSTFFQIQKNDPAIRQLAAETLETSLRERLARAIAAVRQGLSDNQLTPVEATARLAGINQSTLYEIIRKRPHLLPPGIEFRTSLRGKALKEYAISRTVTLLSTITLPSLLSFDEIAEKLGLHPDALRTWQRRFPEVAEIIHTIIPDARRTPSGNIQNAEVSTRQAERLKKVESASRDYQEANPGQLIPVNAMMAATRIPENTLLRLIQKNEDYLRSQGIEFRSSRRGNKKEEYALARIAEVKKEVEEGKVFAVGDKTELCRRLGISRNTILNWERSSERIRDAIAELVASDNNTVGRLHRRDQMPEEERPTAFAQAYKTVSKGRDLGREPVKVPELADAIGYSEANIYNWINNIPQIIRPGMVLDLRHGRRNKTQRRRRIQWALNFARKNGFTYLSLNDFLDQRIGICRGSFNLWKKADPQLPNIFEKEEYEGIIN